MDLNKLQHLSQTQNNTSGKALACNTNEQTDKVFDMSCNGKGFTPPEKPATDAQTQQARSKCLEASDALHARSNLGQMRMEAAKISGELYCRSKIPQLAALGPDLAEKMDGCMSKSSEAHKLLHSGEVTTEAEADELIARVTAEIEQIQYEAQTYLSRLEKTRALNKTLENFEAQGGDISKINLNKITEELKGDPAESSESAGGKPNIDEVMDKLIEAVEKNDFSDPALQDYVKQEKQEQS